MKKYSAFVAAALISAVFAGCAQNQPQQHVPASSVTSQPQTNTQQTEASPERELSEIEKIIAEAETLTTEELFKRAIEESNGQVMYGVGNSSRGATAGANFIEALLAIDPSYTGTIEWSQPKNNSIFTLLNADINSANNTYSMTLIQDGNQVQSKMIDTGQLLNFVPRQWREAEGVNIELNGDPLTLQTLSKVFMFNNLGDASFTNVWDFVAEGSNPLFMGVNSEPVGKNFLYMLTHEKYSQVIKNAFDALAADQQAYFQRTVEEVEADAAALGFNDPNVKYALAWIKLWCQKYNEQVDDGPIMNQLATVSAVDESALIVYSKLRAVEESPSSSKNNVTVAAYQDEFEGFGGFAYKHFLMIPRTSPLPWTAAAFIAYMTTEVDGFAAWGRDIGGYSANPQINQDHSMAGYVDGVNTFPALNDRGYDWWVSQDGGALVIEDPVYCAQVAFVLSDWIDLIVYGN